MKKINFIVWVDRYDYGSGGNHIMHAIAEKLTSLGENVYTLGTGKKNFEYKIFPIKNFDPKYNDLNQLADGAFDFHFEFDHNKFDKESTIFIYPSGGDYPYLYDFKRVRVVMDSLDRNSSYDSQKTLSFIHLAGYNVTDFKYDGMIRWLDVDSKFWYPTNFQPSINTFLCKKLNHFFNDNDKMKNHVIDNLTKLSHLSNLKNINIDNISGYIVSTDNDGKLLKIKQRDIYSQSDYFLSFDPYTCHNIFAALCGAKSIIVPISLRENHIMSADEYRSLFFPYACPGIAYGFDDLKQVYDKKTNEIRNHLVHAKQVFDSDIKNMAKCCYEKF